MKQFKGQGEIDIRMDSMVRVKKSYESYDGSVQYRTVLRGDSLLVNSGMVKETTKLKFSKELIFQATSFCDENTFQHFNK